MRWILVALGVVVALVAVGLVVEDGEITNAPEEVP